jgi:hypothetical protein
VNRIPDPARSLTVTYDTTIASDRLAARIAALAPGSGPSATGLDDLVLEMLGEAEGGYLPVAAVIDALAASRRTNYGAAEVGDAIDTLCQQDEDDKRRKPPLRLVEVAGSWFAVLTSAGWTLLGKTAKREAKPTAGRVTHSLALHNVARWLEREHCPALLRHDIESNVVRSSDVVREYRQRAEAVRFDPGVEVNDKRRLAGGLFPDLLLRTNWPTPLTATRGALWPGLPKELGADLTIAVEVELSAKGVVGATDKVQRHAAAIKNGWHNGVLWVVTDQRTLDLLKRSALSVGCSEVVANSIHSSHVGHDPEGTGPPASGPGSWAWPEDMWAAAGLLP